LVFWVRSNSGQFLSFFPLSTVPGCFGGSGVFGD
jgi:hypothetical protein